MKILLDTSVLVAALVEPHRRTLRSVAIRQHGAGKRLHVRIA